MPDNPMRPESSELRECRAFVTRALKECLPEVTRAWLADGCHVGTDQSTAPVRLYLDRLPALIERLAEAGLNGFDVACDDRIRREATALALLRRLEGCTLDDVLADCDRLTSSVMQRISDSFASAALPFHAGVVWRVAVDLQMALSLLVRIVQEAFRRREQEEQAWRRKALYASSRAIGHKLRNRLNATMLRMELDLQHRIDASGLEASITRLHEVVLDVFALTRAHETEGTAARSLDQVASEVVEAARPMAEAVEVDLLSTALPSLPVNSMLVRLTLLNAVSAALTCRKLASSASIELRAEYQPNAACRLELRLSGLAVPPYWLVLEGQKTASQRSVITEKSPSLGLAEDAARELGGKLELAREPEFIKLCFTVADQASDLARHLERY